MIFSFFHKTRNNFNVSFSFYTSFIVAVFSICYNNSLHYNNL